MNLFDAGLNILYALMTVDNEIAESEIQEITKYLLRCGFEMAENRIDVAKPEMEDLIMEIGLLGSLSGERLKEQFEVSADFFAAHTSEYQRLKMIDFALKMIAADGVIRDSEKEYFGILGEKWGLDTDRYIKEKIEDMKRDKKHK